MEHVENLLKTTLSEIERILNTRSVVGEPITLDGNTIVPLVAIGFCFGGGGASGKEQKSANMEGYGGGSGGGGGVRPVAVVVIDKNGARVEPVRRGAATVIEKVGEAVVHIMDHRSDKTA
jgi:uncharacterized spore protein YtfJ